jgi:hypothetical protein
MTCTKTAPPLAPTAEYLEEGPGNKYIILFSSLDLVKMRWGRQGVVLLLAACVQGLVWNSSTISYVDAYDAKFCSPLSNLEAADSPLHSFKPQQ